MWFISARQLFLGVAEDNIGTELGAKVSCRSSTGKRTSAQEFRYQILTSSQVHSLVPKLLPCRSYSCRTSIAPPLRVSTWYSKWYGYLVMKILVSGSQRELGRPERKKWGQTVLTTGQSEIIPWKPVKNGRIRSLNTANGSRIMWFCFRWIQVNTRVFK